MSIISPRVIRVFAASPGDVNSERLALEQVINELNDTWGRRSGLTLQLLDWRKHVTPWLGKPPEKTILQRLPVDSWDLFVAIFWSRMGTPTGNINSETGEPFQSGTEEEFTLAYQWNRERNTPKILLYRCKSPVSVDTDPDQLKLVQEFFRQFSSVGRYFGLFTEYESPNDFANSVRGHLTDALFDFQQGAKPSHQASLYINGLEQWLSYVKLSGDPFMDWNARVDENLPNYFHVAVPYFEQLIGNISDVPPSIVVFGEHGYGKTALCQMILHYSKQKPGNRSVLSVLYNDFSQLAEKLLRDERISPRDHIDQILIQASQALVASIEKEKIVVSSTASGEDRLELMRYLSIYGQNLSQPHRKIIEDALNLKFGQTPRMDLPDSYIEVFYGFCRAIHVFNFEMLYILVDQVDECSLLDSDEQIVKFLSPLMKEMNLLEQPNGISSFRFFLPSHLENLLKGNSIRLGERLLTYKLRWEDDDLLHLIEGRLTFASVDQKRPYTRLAELSDSIDDLDLQLVRAAHANPRTLIKLCHYVIEEHCKLPISEDNVQITKESVQKAISRYAEDEPINVGLSQGNLKKPSSLSEERSNSDSARFSSDSVKYLPTPIAVSVAQYFEEQNPTDRIWQAVWVTQSVLQFLSYSLMAIYKRDGIPDAEVDEILRNNVFNPTSPPSLGIWREVIDRLTKRDDLQSNSIFERIKLFRSNKDVGRSIGELTQVRNSVAHGRLSSSEAQILSRINQQLEQLLAALEPVSSLHLGSIESHFVNGDGQLVHNIRIHQGNLVVPQKKQFQIERNYQVGSVILFDPTTMSSVNLWPFIAYTVAEEENCDPIENEICFFDQLLDPQKKKQYFVQYVNPVTKQTYKTKRPLTDLHSMNLI